MCEHYFYVEVRYECGKGKIYYRLRDFLNTDAL